MILICCSSPLRWPPSPSRAPAWDPPDVFKCELDKAARIVDLPRAAAQKAKRWADAAAEFEGAASSLKPDDARGSRLLAAAGNMWIAANQPGKAALALDRALAGKGLVAEQHGEALLDRARAAEAQGDLKTARAKVNRRRRPCAPTLSTGISRPRWRSARRTCRPRSWRSPAP